MSVSLEYSQHLPSSGPMAGLAVPQSAARPRVDSIDLLRGGIMVLMAILLSRVCWAKTHSSPLRR